MRSPLSGLSAWLVQRLSAVFMLGFMVFLLVHFLVDPPGSYEAWRTWMGDVPVSVAAGVFVAALLAHAWVGLRDVTLDYVASLAARVAVLSLIAATLVAVAVFAFRILFLAHG
ncbi:MAG: succinate dehydrogenase, hydrophobic membrane anchor protein [Burkholderiales bacterium]